jgi:hypothetical protein
VRQRLLIAGTLAVMAATPRSGAAESISEQIVVVRLPSPASRLTVDRQIGDNVALLSVHRPPPDLVGILHAQRGRYFTGVSRRSVLDDEMVVALELSSSSVQVDARRVEGTAAVILTIRPVTAPLHPDHREYFAAIPGIFELGRLPLELPPEPTDAPCPARVANDRLAWAVPAEHVDERLGLVEDPQCAAYLAGRLALEAINSGRSLAPFERWAFEFDPGRPWPERRRAQAMTTLVVAGVLARTHYFPEAEIALTTPDIFRPRSLRYYQAVGMAHLELERGRPEAVRSIVEPLIETGAPDEVKELGAILAILSSTRAGQVAPALETARRAWDAIADHNSVGADLATLAGEIALAAGDATAAEHWFGRGASVLGTRSGRAQRASALRLADFAAQRGRFRNAKRIIARVRPQGPCETALHELRKKLMALDEADPVLRFLESIVKQPACTAEQREARFILAQTYVQAGLPELAVPLAWQVRDEVPLDYRHTNEPLPLLRRAVRGAAARLARHQRWQALIRLYEEHVAEKQALHLLDGATLINVARAYIESGAPESASSVLTTRLAKGLDPESRREVSTTLVEAYLRDDDLYRADLVLNYFEKTFGRELPYFVELNRARLDLLREDAESALQRVRGLSTPRGDPQFQRLEIIARAELALGRPFAAASTYVDAIGLPNAGALEHPEDVVRTLSRCARDDRSGACATLYVAARRRVSPSPRLQAHAERLGWIEGAPARSALAADSTTPRKDEDGSPNR